MGRTALYWGGIPTGKFVPARGVGQSWGPASFAWQLFDVQELGQARAIQVYPFP